MTSGPRRCYELESVDRYSPAARDYAAGRPSYPPEAIAHILRQCTKLRPRIVDVGAGTAFGTRLLAGQAGLAIALEPNAEMIDAAQSPTGVVWLRGRAEQLPLRARSVDLLTAFCAFHWFQPATFLEEAHRVLEPTGRLALLWNDWDHRDPFTAAFVKLMRAHAGDFPPEDREAEVAPLYETPHFDHVEKRAYPLRHRLDRIGLMARMRSISYIPRDEPRWQPLEVALGALFEEYADATGSVTHHYATHVFVATPRP